MMRCNFFKNYNSILCLNGKLPAKKFFNTDKIIIAADGAANKLIKLGITPSLILGDLDSISHKNINAENIIPLLDQNETDFEKSLKYLAEHNLTPTLVCGVNGGFIDHILQNINIILQNDSMFYAPPLVGMVIKKNESLKIELPINSKISLFGINSRVTTQGLKWELNNNLLEFPGKNSCFNRTISETITIESLHGKTLTLIYTTKQIDKGL